MATLKGRAQQSLFAVKKRVRLSPLTVGDATAIAFTVVRSSPHALLRAAYASKEAKTFPKNPNQRVFYNAVNSVVDHRKGSLYAAFVTSVDVSGVYNADRFATSLKRLGILDDLKVKLTADGFGEAATLISNKAPYFWADLTSREIDTVRKEVSGVVQRVVSRFKEDIDEKDIDELIEAQVFRLKPSTLSPRAQLLHGASQLDVGGGYQSIFLNLFRKLAQNSRVTLLNQNSSLEATFESFHQHLMTNTSALQRLLPKAKFGKQPLTPQQIQRLFRDSQLTRQMRKAFESSYDSKQHAIRVDALYRGMRRYNVMVDLQRAAKSKLRKNLNDDAVSGILSSVVGLFFAFAGDTKGQSFPAMKSIAKG